MNVHTCELLFRSRRDCFRFWFIGDAHLGSAQCDEERLRRDIETIRVDPRAWAFLLGDICEYITPRDSRYDEHLIAEWVDRDDIGNSQVQRAVELLHPIRKRIIGAIQGNHEYVIQREFNSAVHARLCGELGIQDLGYSALVRVKLRWPRGRTARGQVGGSYDSLDIYLHHGYGGGRTFGADANRFGEMMRDYDADLYVAGHTHQRYAAKTIQHYLTHADTLGARTRLFCRAGTYLRTVTVGGAGYAERAGMRPIQTGALCVTYQPHNGSQGEMAANV